MTMGVSPPAPALAGSRSAGPRRSSAPLDLPRNPPLYGGCNIVVTDGYGNDRVVFCRLDGPFLKQVGQGARKNLVPVTP